MRSLFALLVLVPLAVNAADRLQGSWHSDLDESRRFYEAHSVLEPRQSDFLNGLLGHLQLDISKSELRYTMPDLDVQIQGKPFHMTGEHDTYQYRVLGSDQASTAILVKNDHGRDRIWHLHFVNDDLLWIYSEDADFGLRDLNFREYFRKVK
jgi:hypothetical protein